MFDYADYSNDINTNIDIRILNFHDPMTSNTYLIDVKPEPGPLAPDINLPL